MTSSFSTNRILRALILLNVVCLGIQGGVSQTADSESRHYEIAVIKDGPSWYFDASIERALDELRALSNDQYTFTARDSFDAGYDSQRVARDLQSALSDESVDLIFAAGVLATEMSASLSDEQRTKPIIGGALQFSNVRDASISAEGTSQLNNYTFVTHPRRVSADLQMLEEISGASTIYAIVDELYLPIMEDLPESRRELEEAFQVQIEIVPGNDSVAATIGRIPEGARAVYVSILARMDENAREELYRQLADKGILAMAMTGHLGVELGALAGLAPDDGQAVARRMALNMHQILQGLSTDYLPVYLPVFDRLRVNMETAARADWSPSYDISLAAEFVGESELSQAEPIDLLTAMQKGAEENIDVIISRESQIADELDVEVTRRQFAPKIDGSASYLRQHTWDRINPLTTPDYFHQESLGVQISKILFSDALWSAVKARELVAEAAAVNALSSELDGAGAAASSYFDYLTSESLYVIERENLALTESNYQLAQLRIEIGAAEPVEEFRWEQLRARARANLIQRESDRANALVAFNLQIGAPREKLWRFEDIELADEEIYFLDDALSPLLANAKRFAEFGGFVQAFAVDNSPELLAFDLQLASQGILLKESQRRFMPEISGFADYASVFQGSEFFNTDNENQASVGVQVSLPIFEGGQRKAEALRNQAVIRGLGAQREKAKQQIEQRALAAFNEVGAAHPNLRLSRVSLEAAEKTYESIQEKYSQGAASILDLLDAQEALLSQRQQAAVAVYAYLASVHDLQRSIAWFEYQKSPAEKSAWVNAVRRYLDTGGRVPQNLDEARDDARSRAKRALEESVVP